MRSFPLLTALLVSLAATPLAALDLDEAYAAIGRSRSEFDAAAGRMPREEARFLERFFELTDRTVVENVQVVPWFLSGGREGIHFSVYSERVSVLLDAFESLEPPPRLSRMLQLVQQAIAGQREFLSEWHAAIEAGKSFDSQLGDEYGYHEGLHLSHRRLLLAYGELLGLYAGEGEANRRAFYDHLCALDLL